MSKTHITIEGDFCRSKYLDELKKDCRSLESKFDIGYMVRINNHAEYKFADWEENEMEERRIIIVTDVKNPQEAQELFDDFKELEQKWGISYDLTVNAEKYPFYTNSVRHRDR